MDKNEALHIAEAELSPYRAMPYEQLAHLIHSDFITKEVVAPSGTAYQVSIHAFWDDEIKRNVRVCCNIDDGSWWRGRFPLSTDFILTSNGTFIGE